MSTPYEQHPERFLTAHGQDFPSYTVRLVYPEDRYGRNGCLVHGRDEPLVEFYDNDFNFNEWLGITGQFVSRYYINTLLERNLFVGLCLEGGEPKWMLGVEEMQEIRAWLVARLIAELKDCRRKEP